MSTPRIDWTRVNDGIYRAVVDGHTFTLRWTAAWLVVEDGRLVEQLAFPERVVPKPQADTAIRQYLAGT